MNNTIHYTHCPVCNSSAIAPVLSAIDHTVSGETFGVWHCSGCALRFTQDVPDEASIAPYYQSEDYISHTDSGNGLVNKVYKLVRKRTLLQKASLVQEHTGMKKGRLLDVGCGTGAFLNVVQSRGWDTQGLEPDTQARALALRLYGVVAEAPSRLFDLSPSSFDAITMWHVLEHVHELHRYMNRLNELLTPNGKLIIAVPNYTALDAQTYGSNWAAYDVPRHLYHFSPAAMTALAARHGLHVVHKHPLWFDSFYISLLSSKYERGGTAYFSAMINGLRSNSAAMRDRDRCSSIVYVLTKA